MKTTMNPQTALTISTPRISKSATGKAYRVRWYMNKKQKERKFDTKAEAENFSARITNARINGEAFSLATGLPASWEQTSVTVVEAAATYIAQHRADWAYNTLKNNVFHLSRMCLTLGYRTAIDITPENLEEMRGILTGQRTDSRNSIGMDELSKREFASRWSKALVRAYSDEELSSGTQNNVRRISKSFFIWAVDTELIDSMPMPAQKRTRKQRVAKVVKTDEMMTADEAKAVIAFAPNNTYRLLFTTMLRSGMRTGEARAIRVNDLLDGNRIRIDETAAVQSLDTQIVGPTKTGHSRTIRIASDLHAELTALAAGKNDSDFLFTLDNVHPIPHGTVTYTWHKMTGSWRVYDLRHIHASTLLVSPDWSPLEVADRMGHSVITLMSTYAHLLSSGDSQEKIDEVI